MLRGKVAMVFLFRLSDLSYGLLWLSPIRTPTTVQWAKMTAFAEMFYSEIPSGWWPSHLFQHLDIPPRTGSMLGLPSSKTIVLHLSGSSSNLAYSFSGHSHQKLPARPLHFTLSSCVLCPSAQSLWICLPRSLNKLSINPEPYSLQVVSHYYTLASLLLWYLAVGRFASVNVVLHHTL